MGSETSRKVNCPQCGLLVSFSKTENPFRPFCSERCQILDLGSWASETYKVPVENENPASFQDRHEDELEDEN